MDKKAILASALLLVASQLATAAPKGKASADPEGKCYGVVGKEEGDCGGKNPATGETWSCAGQNPSADLGWKKMKKSECDAKAKHADAKEKKFVANK